MAFKKEGVCPPRGHEEGQANTYLGEPEPPGHREKAELGGIFEMAKPTYLIFQKQKQSWTLNDSNEWPRPPHWDESCPHGGA